MIVSGLRGTKKRKGIAVNLNPRFMRILVHLISKNRDLFSMNLQQVYKASVTLEKFEYSEGLEFNLISLSQVERPSRKTDLFFMLASKYLTSELADLFMIDPYDISKLCKFPTNQKLAH